MGDRIWVILTWAILLAAGLGLLRYWRGANALARTGLGFVFGTEQLLAGFQPGTGNVPAYPAYNSQGA